MPIANQIDLKPRHLAMVKAILAEYAQGYPVWAYGSRVTHTGHEGSDLDLVIHQANSEIVSRLRLAFQQSLLPMIIDLHQWETLPVRFHHNIQQHYFVLQ